MGQPKQGLFTGDLASPIQVVLSGDKDSDDVAIRDAFGCLWAKLPALADQLGFKLDNMASLDWLFSQITMALACETIPGFQLKIKKRSGRKVEKDTQYFLWLSAAYEMFVQKNGDKITKSAFAQSLANHEYLQKNYGRIRRSAKAIIDRRAAQIRNDLSAVSHPIYRHFVREIIRLSSTGMSPDEIANHIDRIAES